MPENIPFTPEQREHIADFIHSYECDTLIKADGLKLIDALEAHSLILWPIRFRNMVNNQSPYALQMLIDVVKVRINEAQRIVIMNEYYENAKQMCASMGMQYRNTLKCRTF